MNDDDELLAAEFALGLLDNAEADAVLARARGDAALSLRIAWWRDQFAPLSREAETPPSRDLWPAIAAKLPANDDARGAVSRWRTLALSSMAVAAALLAFIVLRPPPVPIVQQIMPAPMVASLAGEGGALVTLAYDQTSGRVSTVPAALDAGRGDAELWVIPADGTPRSLGVIASARRSQHVVEVKMRSMLDEGATFAISIEPIGGSPTGAPTGPVVATGKVTRL